MKWLILLGLLSVVVFFIASRYRRQIQMGLYVWRMFRKMRKAGKSDDKRIKTKDPEKNLPLIRCAQCGSWTPQKDALNLRSGTVYCTANCMEKAVKV
jgi:hypothetical protein